MLTVETASERRSSSRVTYQQLEQAEDWQHPAELLDADGALGVHYQELLHIARHRAQAVRAADRSGDIVGKLEAAWAQEKARSEVTESIASRFLGFDPAETELLLRRVDQEVRWRLRQRQRSVEGVS